MPHTSVILRCPDALYAWYEAQLQPGAKIEEVMLLALLLWTKYYPGSRQDQLIEALSAHDPPPPPPEPAPMRPKGSWECLPEAEPAQRAVVPKAGGAKYRKKNNRRRVRR